MRSPLCSRNRRLHSVALAAVCSLAATIVVAQAKRSDRATDAPELELPTRRLSDARSIDLPGADGTTRSLVRDAIVWRHDFDYTWLGHDAATGEPTRFAVKGAHASGYIGVGDRNRPYAEGLTLTATGTSGPAPPGRPPRPVLRYDDGAGRPCPTPVAFQVAPEVFARVPQIRALCQLAIDEYNLRLLTEGDGTKALLTLQLVARPSSPLHEFVDAAYRLEIDSDLGPDGSRQALRAEDLLRPGRFAEAIALAARGDSNPAPLDLQLPEGATLRSGEELSLFATSGLWGLGPSAFRFEAGATARFRGGEHAEFVDYGLVQDGSIVHVSRGSCHVTYPVYGEAAVSDSSEVPVGNPAVEFTVYPSAATAGSRVTVRLDARCTEIPLTSMSIVDGVGRRLYTLPAHDVAPLTRAFSFKLPDLIAGTYYLEIRSGNRVYAQPITVAN